MIDNKVIEDNLIILKNEELNSMALRTVANVEYWKLRKYCQRLEKALDKICNLVGYEYNYCCHHSEVDGKCKGGSCLECWKGWAIEG